MKITTHKELIVFKMSFELGMRIFFLTKEFPKEEMYSLTDQIRRASRSVSANIAEAFRSRLYKKSFISKLVIAESEAAECQTWLDYAFRCNYINQNEHNELYSEYDNLIGKLVIMIHSSEKWCLNS